MRVPLKLKNKDFTKRGFAKLGVVGYVPIAIRRYNDISVFSALQQQKMLSPSAMKVSRPMDANMKQAVMRDFPELTPMITEAKGLLLIKEYDTTSEEHIKATEEFKLIQQDLGVIHFFDFDYKNDEGDDLWSGWEVERGNYVEFVKKYKSINITDEDITLFMSEIDKVKKGELTIAQCEINLAQSVIDMIDGYCNNVNAETDVSGIEELYSGLSDNVKELIGNYDKLAEIKATISEIKVVEDKPKKVKKSKEVIIDAEIGATE